jgi:hypothetical protein
VDVVSGLGCSLVGAFVCKSLGEAAGGELLAFGCDGFAQAAKIKQPAMIRRLRKMGVRLARSVGRLAPPLRLDNANR